MEEQMISAASPGFVARGTKVTKRSVDCESPKALKLRPLANLWEANPAMAPKLYT